MVGFCGKAIRVASYGYAWISGWRLGATRLSKKDKFDEESSHSNRRGCFGTTITGKSSGYYVDTRDENRKSRNWLITPETRNENNSPRLLAYGSWLEDQHVRQCRLAKEASVEELGESSSKETGVRRRAGYGVKVTGTGWNLAGLLGNHEASRTNRDADLAGVDYSRVRWLEVVTDASTTCRKTRQCRT